MQNALALPRYLVEISLNRLWEVFGNHPFLAWPALAALYGVVLALLRRWFDNLDYDTYVFAAIVTAIFVFVAIGIYTLMTGQGFHMH